MQEKEYLTVSEAVQLSGKPEVTIRRLIKRLSTDSQTQSFVTVIDSQNPKSIYQIKRDYLIKFYNIRGKTSDSQVTVSDNSNDSQVTVMQQFIDLLLNQMDSKDEQIKRKDDELERLHHLLENQQKMTMHSQVQLEKTQLTLEESKKKKKVLGLF
jgi:hypothetical protein